jgi:phosphoglycerate dehydrogenase-like enzyme
MIGIRVVHKVAWDDLAWERLKSIGPYAYFPDYPESDEDLLRRIGDGDIVIGADVVFSSRILHESRNLKMISVWSTGVDNVDLAAARECGILVSNVPGYSAYSVAEHAWAMALSLVKRLPEADAHVRSGSFDWSAIRGIEVYGKTAGIVGSGAIGSHCARIAQGLGCRVIATTKHPGRERAGALGVEFVSLDELLQHSDLIFISTSLNAETRNLIDAGAFGKMARRPVLINTARGGIVEADAMLDALESGRISGLGLDVLWKEPPDWNSPAFQRLLAAEGVILSPHCASHTGEAFARLTDVCLDNIEAYLNGSPTNVVSG